MNFLKYSIFRALWSLLKNGYLKEMGWYRSFCMHSAVDSQGAPIPWINYSMLHFLSSRISDSISVLEFGGGNSSVYWAQKTREVFTVEHDKKWAAYLDKMFAALPNAHLIVAEEDDSYEKAPAALEKKFQLIVIDGTRRIECLKNALGSLSDDGCILLDDTERQEYQEAFNFMDSCGFKVIRISGMKPIQNDFSEAAIFYRSLNFLGI